MTSDVITASLRSQWRPTLEPRLKNSKRWTELPQELKTQLEDVFTEKFDSDYDLNGKFEVKGKIFPNELLLQAGIHNPKKLAQKHFLVSVELAETENPEKQFMQYINLATDFLGELWEEFLEEEFEAPKSWQHAIFNKKELYYYFHTANSELETQADKILGLDDNKLAQGNWSVDLDNEDTEGVLFDPNLPPSENLH